MSSLIKSFDVPGYVRKKTNMAKVQFYNKLEIYDNKLVGYNDDGEISWFYKDYNNIQVIDANLNSQYARIVFVTDGSGNKKEVLVSTMTNVSIIGDINKILFCSGMFSYKSANTYARDVFEVLINAFRNYKENSDKCNSTFNSSADEIKKYKELLDVGAISQEEFEAKKKQLLGL